ncbi:cell envelope integrity protein TolA [Rickettsiella endosymbiont of Dermanyssus gallinae]|uniref:cell envelope integrity protein TolA n=1 Tax=Rickettsiella endosymbiont of Dermanyssus gallinae TaxID=2856608 RepID=UPI001C52BEF6|nr:cell envelope integrity protein TolA [Rickettsiella endosymbiont of Dermanyssus gallinae]
MLPNTNISVADSAEQLLQRNSLLYRWVTNCFSIVKIKSNIWTPEWIESLKIALKKANSETIKQGYKLLTEEFNSKLGQLYSTNENSQNDWVSALLLQLLAMDVYRKTTTECCHDQLMECPSMRWTNYANRVITIVPKEVYLKQLSRLVGEAVSKKPIDSTVDYVLLQIHQHALKFCFKRFLNGLRHTTQDSPPPDEENSAYQSYIQMICMLHVYITRVSNLPLKEKQRLPNLLLEQLKQLIEETCELDLSPSWMERLRQWIQQFFGKLKLLYTTIPSTVETSSSALLIISQQLRKSAKQAAQKKESHSSELIRERCWLYFSLYEQIITQYWDKEKYALNYQSTTLALFESFMSTFAFEPPSTFEKGILRANPLKSQGFFTFSRKKVAPEHLEFLLDTALNKLCVDFINNWFYHDYSANKGSISLLHWLIFRQEPRLMAKIKAYASTEDYTQFRGLAEIPSFEKETLYRFVQDAHKDFCIDLNLLTRMIVSIWLKKIGIIVSHYDLANSLLKPERWLYQTNPVASVPWKDTIPNLAWVLLHAVERLGVGLYFFPPIQQRWSVFQEAWTEHSGSIAEFVYQQDKEIAAILNKLFLTFHLDHESEAKRNDPMLKDWAQNYIPYIKSAKQTLRKFRARDPNELQSLDAKKEAESLLNELKDIVLYCMHCDVKYVRCMLEDDPDISSKLSELRQLHVERIRTRKETEEINKRTEEICKETEEIRKETKEIRKETESERKEKEAAQAREKEERKEKEATQAREKEAQAEIEHLKALLAEQEGQTLPQPSVAGSRSMLFPAPTTPQASTTAAQDTEIAGTSNSVFPNR